MAKKEPSAPIDAETLAQTVETWFGETLRGGAIARNTDAYNQAFQAKNDLVARLKKLLPPSPAADAKSGGQASTDESAAPQRQPNIGEQA